METVVASMPADTMNQSSHIPQLSVEGLPPGQNASNVNHSWGLLHHKSRPPEYLEYSNPGSTGLQVFAVMIIMTTAIFGNSLMCYAVYKTPSLRTMANLFTINLGLSDLCLSILVFPVWISALVSGAANPRHQPPFSMELCQATAFITVLLLLVSIATMAGVSLDRYFIICHPLRYPMEITPRRVYTVLLYIWAQSTTLASLPFMGWGYYTFRPQTIPICNPAWNWNAGHASFLILVGMATPFCVMVFSYTRVVQAARRQWARISEIQLQLVRQPTSASSSDEEDHGESRDVGRGFRKRPSIFQRLMRRKSSASSVGFSYNSLARNIRTLRTIFIVVGAFFVCWGPYVVVQIWAVNNSDKPLPYLADLFTTLLAFSNSAINPFIFMMLNRDFRFALRLMVARMLQMMGEEEAVHKVKISGHRDSMVESFRLHSRASFDSGVIVEPRPLGTGEAILKPPLESIPLLAKDKMPEKYRPKSGFCETSFRSPLCSKQQSISEREGNGQTHQWLLDTPVPQSYQAFGESQTLQPSQKYTLKVPECDYDIDINASLQHYEPDGPTFIVPNGNIPIIIIDKDYS